MGSRRQGRELALQALYRADVTDDVTPEGLDLLWEHFGAAPNARTFALHLVRGVLDRGDEIDELIREALRHWAFDRLSRVERNVLRIGACELLDSSGPPKNVVIDEAIEIARRYGGDDSSGFVNGVLDRVADVVGVRQGAEQA